MQNQANRLHSNILQVRLKYTLNRGTYAHVKNLAVTP